MADSGISSIKELKGKKVAFGSIGSTSKHLAPMLELKF
jgi:phosphonate transport system substrate-binding protein